MSYLELTEDVSLEPDLQDLNEDVNDSQDEVAEQSSPFSADEHYLEEPTGYEGSITSTQDSPEHFQRGWRIDRHAGDSWVYGTDTPFYSYEETLIDAMKLALLPSKPRDDGIPSCWAFDIRAVLLTWIHYTPS